MNFRTEIGTMEGAANNVDSINSNVQAELQRLAAVVEGTAGSWRGDAQNAFQALMERWNTSARQLSEALQSISENLRANARAFDETEMANQAAFR
ncbi:WXG100 family type VII secretion target [Corynebacterium heidelbergense]|uniref:ESAT-6-like protein n=1 Tax=Corynebacterium heidelbergense TaxID=2055947 RepID=A0A364VCS1_9CORY|nr:WXG100 family type VII secretion target [Corynebacterium heidelbergense]RAV34420.1 WXG100 family type VII secretion target [Corynebacterium heidelbergense]WCZ37293.1 WXG domain conatining protein [Corynebacterium heidelbergense]